MKRPVAANALLLCLLVAGTGCSAPDSSAPNAPVSSPPAATTGGPADLPSATSTNRLQPGGSINNSSGVATFMDGAVWLPVGSELSRVDTEGNPIPTDTSLTRIDPATGKVTARVPLSGTGTVSFALGDDIVVKTPTGADVISTKTLRHERTLPGGVVSGFGSVWDIGGRSSGRRGVDDNTTLLRIDPASGKITGRLIVQDATVEEGHEWNPDPQLTVGAGAVWVGIGKSRSVLRVDPKTLRPGPPIRLDDIEDFVVVGFGFDSVWAHQSTNGAGKLYRIDPATQKVINTVDLGDPSLDSTGGGGSTLAFGHGSVWTCDSSGTLTETDAATTSVKTVTKLPIEDCTWLSADTDSIWISNSHNSTQPLTFRIEL